MCTNETEIGRLNSQEMSQKIEKQTRSSVKSCSKTIVFLPHEK